MTKKNDFTCPECGSNINAWADIDATAKFDVKKNGELKPPTISNSIQSDGRCGVECKECDWEAHGHDLDEESPLFRLANEALKQQSEINFLSPKRQRKTSQGRKAKY